MLGVNRRLYQLLQCPERQLPQGVHKMETLLENPTHAKEFANLGKRCPSCWFR